MSFLETRSVGKVYRTGSSGSVHALDDVSLIVPRGAFAVLTGPSGSGKTTLLALQGALERPSHGQVFFDGRELGALSDVALARLRRRLGFIFQDFSLIPSLPVWANISYPLIPRGIAGVQRQRITRAVLERLGLGDKISALPERLSGGEQQRVAIARALAGEPEVLLADEPTSNLDPATADELLTLFREFHAAGKTVLVSTHDPRLIALATQVHTLRAGRLVLP